MIRPATLIDVPRMVDLAEQMHTESRFTMLRFDREKMAQVITTLIDHAGALALVAVKDGAVIGGFLGVTEEHFFSRDKFAFDLATFIAPEHRGGFVAVRLLRRYVAWAKEQGIACINAGIASGINHDVSVRLYERIGFVNTGVAFEYQEQP